MEGLVIVELVPDQARFFQLCNTNYNTIDFMNLSGVFQLSNASATLNFDSAGILKSIKREIYAYAPKNS